MRPVLNRLLGLESQTRAEKSAAINGMNLFFGALIGANLGSLHEINLRDYLLIAIIVCMIVLYIQVVPVTRQRWKYLVQLGLMVAGLYVLLLHPLGADLFRERPRPSPHIFITICLWLASVASVEFRPLAREPATSLLEG
jgi:hypothetical protein